MLGLSMDQITQDTEGQARIPGLYLMDSKEPLWDRWWVRCDSKWRMLGTQMTGGNQKAVAKNTNMKRTGRKERRGCMPKIFRREN